MDRIEIQSLIDRVIGKRGIMRSPAWWVRRLLNKMLDYCESLTPNIEIKTEAQVNDSANPVQSKAVKEYVDAAQTATDSRLTEIDTKIGEIDTTLDKINGEEI